MKKALIIVALVVALAGAAAWALKQHAESQPQALDLMITLTCDTHGRLEPCGCFSGQLGGLSRIDTLLAEYHPEQEIRVDAGDAIEGIEDYNLIEYRYILEAYAGMHFDALNIGHLLSQLPAEKIVEIAAASPVPMISANLKHKTTGALLLEPFQIIKRGPYRIAIVGVVDSNRDEGEFGENVVAAKMATALGNLMPEIKKQSDAIILLAFTDEQGMARLAEEFYELEVILGGNVDQPAQGLEGANQSTIFYTTNQARALAQLGMRFAEDGTFRPIDGRIQLVLEGVPESERVIKLAEAYRQEVRDTELAVDRPETLAEDQVPGVAAAATYTDNAACLGCHQTAANSWIHSRHGGAFLALEHKKSEADPSCLPCHTVGFGTPSGYRRAYKKEKLIHVGCESCHGPGSAHVAFKTGQSTTPFTFRPLGAGDCTQCHHGEFSRPFDWDTWWPPVKHGKDAPAP